MSKSSTGEWLLDASQGLTAAILGNGLANLNQTLAGGPAQRIAGSLMRLVSATRRPAWMDDETAAVYFDTLQEALHDYPIDVVEEACIQWRKGQNGEWWPAEAELRRVCIKLFEPRERLRGQAMRLMSELEAKEAQRQRAASPFAGDKAQRFRSEMRKRMLPRTFNAYFDSSHIMYGPEEVWVRSKTAARVLSEQGRDLLEQLGLRVAFRQAAFLNVREPTYDDDTLEEREATAVLFNRLRQAMANGENIKKLRREGVL